MKIQRILLFILLLFSPIFSYAETNNKNYFISQNFYQNFKDNLKKYGISYSVDITYMPQINFSHNNVVPQQFMISPNMNLNIFSNKQYGVLDLQFSYSIVNYWSKQAQILQNNLNAITNINDSINTDKQFSQLLLSYTLANNMNCLSLNIGQYSLYSIDGTFPIYNQQTTFINYSLSQNATATYPTASLGAYLQFAPTNELLMQIGFQDANNIDGERIEFNNLNSNKYTTYAYIYWNPTFKNNLAGQYTLLAYNQPSTEKQSGNSKGLSFSFSQYLGNIFNIFGRINGSTGNITTIKQSYVVGFGFKNLFKRNINDYLGFAFTTNKLNERAIDTPLTHRYENIIEAQYVIGLGNYITITPDIQYIINPALDVDKNSAFVYSLRLGVSI